MKKFKRVFVIVADSLGVGHLPDSSKYGDVNTNTFSHLSYAKSDFSIPTLEMLGAGHITDINNTSSTNSPIGSFGKMQEVSVGKDTLTGHWEIMGLEVTKSFPSFTDNGFPKELIDELEKQTGRKVVGNCAASGTEILKDLGEHHLKTGDIIVYTSADSVLQIAAHEEVVSLDELYDICHKARKITLDNPDWMVGRIIARPFVGESKDTFKRTPHRHDYAVKPFGKTALVSLKEAGYDVISVGKIKDIFDGEGITESNTIKSNAHGMDVTIDIAKRDFNGLCFVNLVDFDALYGHRRDSIGYANCVEEFDGKLEVLLPLLGDDDLLIITADHGNDPTHTGTDHTREHTPLIVYSKSLSSVDLGVRKSFADISATICENFDVTKTELGESFLGELKVK